MIIGEYGVGKSQILQKFLKNEFNENYDPTFKETKTHQICINNEQI